MKNKKNWMKAVFVAPADIVTPKIMQPSTNKAPVVVSIPHSGFIIPENIRDSFYKKDALFLTQDCELYIDEFFVKVPELGATVVYQTINRYVIDLNRDAKVVDASFLDCGPELTSPPNLGLVPHKTVGGDVLLKTPLSREDLEERVNLYYVPFYKQLDAALKQAKEDFGYYIHIDAHSNPTRGIHKNAKCNHGSNSKERPDIVLSNRMGASCSNDLMMEVKDYLIKAGFSVSCNDPYRGRYIAQRFGMPEHNQHTLQIEFNRKIYMNEATHDYDEKMLQHLQKVMTSLVSELTKIKM